MIALPLSQAPLLVPRLRSPASFPAAAQRVDALLASGEAELINWVQVQTMSGNKPTTESIEEVRHPTFFNPSPGPRRPRKHSLFVRSILERHPGLADEDGHFYGMRGVHIRREPQSCFEPFAVPSSFDTRNTGALLEVEFQLEGDQIEVALAASLVRFEGMDTTVGGRPGTPTSRSYPWGRFSDDKVQTPFTIANGGGLLLGSFTLPTPKPRMLLFLFRASAQLQSPPVP